jgi:hypothetical protein
MQEQVRTRVRAVQAGNSTTAKPGADGSWRMERANERCAVRCG